MSEAVKIDKNDLTQGPILKKLFLYFLPIAAGALFQQLYNAVDAIVVGRFVGTEALASVGGSPSILIQLSSSFEAQKYRSPLMLDYVEHQEPL